ncbi:MAG: Crp/Fnr family transcriptional regulator [Fimbriimonas sp.]
MDIAKELNHTYLFRGLSPAVISTIAALASVKSFQGGDTLMRQFERSNDLFILLEGEARIRSFSGESIAEFGPGSVLGEMSLIDDLPRSATVVAVGKVRAAVLSAPLLQSIMDMDSAVAATIHANLAKVLSRKLRSMNSQVERQDETKRLTHV